MSDVVRPVMRYFGGKWRLADWIIAHFPPHLVYTEAFGGAASLLLRKRPAKVDVYNDVDGEVVNVFRVLRDPQKWPELQRRMRCMPYARAEFERREDPSDDIDRALWTLFISRAGFGANAMFGQATSMRIRRDDRSTPAHEWGALWPEVARWAERFSGVMVECGPAVDVLARYDSPSALHYVDPPYMHATRGKRNRYRYELADQDHRDLVATLRDLAGMVVLSGYQCDLYHELLGDWKRIDRKHLADGARSRVESLWLSPSAVAACDPRLIA